MKKERTGEPPLPKHGSLRDGEHAGNLLIFQAAEEAQLDYLGPGAAICGCVAPRSQRIP